MFWLKVLKYWLKYLSRKCTDREWGHTFILFNRKFKESMNFESFWIKRMKKHEQDTLELKKVLIWLTKGCSEDKCCCSWPWDGSHQLTRDWYHTAYIRKCKSGCVIPGQSESDLVKTQTTFTSCWEKMSENFLKAMKFMLKYFMQN